MVKNKKQSLISKIFIITILLITLTSLLAYAYDLNLTATEKQNLQAASDAAFVTEATYLPTVLFGNSNIKGTHATKQTFNTRTDIYNDKARNITDNYYGFNDYDKDASGSEDALNEVNALFCLRQGSNLPSTHRGAGRDTFKGDHLNNNGETSQHWSEATAALLDGIKYDLCAFLKLDSSGSSWKWETENSYESYGGQSFPKRDTRTHIYVDNFEKDDTYRGNLKKPTEPGIFQDYCNKGDADQFIRASNIIWFPPTDVPDLTSFSTAHATSNVGFNSYMIAYTATFNNTLKSGSDTEYLENIVQRVIWAIGNGVHIQNDLYYSAYTVDELARQITAHPSYEGKTGAYPQVKPITFSELMTSKHDQNTSDSNMTNGYYHQSCGTVYDESSDSYIIGPFQMSDYALVNSYNNYVGNYSGKDLTDQPKIVGGIVDGFLNLNNGSQLSFDNNDVEILYYYGGDRERKGGFDVITGYVRNLPGDILDGEPINIVAHYIVTGYGNIRDDIEDKHTQPQGASSLYYTINGYRAYFDGDAIVTNGQRIPFRPTTETIKVWDIPTEDEYPYPYPNATFYVKVNRSSCGNATSLTGMTFNYRTTISEGKGFILEGKYLQSLWGRQNSVDYCEELYGCKTCAHTLEASSDGEYIYHDSTNTTFKVNHDDDTETRTEGGGKHVKWCLGNGYCEYYKNVTSFGSSTEQGNCSASFHYMTAGYCAHQHIAWTSKDSPGCYGTTWSYDCGETSHTHGDSCYDDEGELTCTKDEHTHTEDCKEYSSTGVASNCAHECSYDQGCRTSHDCTKDYCEHGYHYGKHYNDYSAKDTPRATDWCTAQTYCRHNHTTCQTTEWHATVTIKDPQPLIVIEDAKTYVKKTESKTNLDIRLTTDIEINKYIVDVEHINPTLVAKAGDTSYVKSTSRSAMTETAKLADPVYAEFGDIITYNIDIINHSDLQTDMKIDDYLPPELNENAEVKEVSFTYYDATGGPKVVLQDWFEWTNEEAITWIHVPGNATVTIEVKLKVDTHVRDTEGINKVDIITRNMIEKKGSSFTAVDDDTGMPIQWGYTNPINVDYMRRDDINDVSNACIVGPVVNLSEIENRPIENSDKFKVQDYSVEINKYAYGYNDKILEFNNGANTDSIDKTPVKYTTEDKIAADSNLYPLNNSRKEYTEEEKFNKPLSVEQREQIIYKINVTNTAESNGGLKYATQVRPAMVMDYIQLGLEYDPGSITAQIFDKDNHPVTRFGTMAVNVTATLEGVTTNDGIKCKAYKFEISPDVILNPGDRIEYTYSVTVTESNMYLYKLCNKAEIEILTNINYTKGSYYYVKATNRVTDTKPNDKSPSPYDENIKQDNEISREYVRMKDLVIAGFIWLDLDRDGYMNDKVQDYYNGQQFINTDATNNKTYGSVEDIYNAYNVNPSSMKNNVTVKLYKDIDGTNGLLLRTTKTDTDGFYTFARNENLEYYTSTYNYNTGFNALTTYQRIDKAEPTDKDEWGSYKDGALSVKYYIEYEYDGVIYKSTVYSGMDNLNIANGDYENYNNKKYLIDSNAAEFINAREEFNKIYEYISYNTSYDIDLNTTDQSTFQYIKNGHSSILIENPERVMTSRSFITTYDYEAVRQAIRTVAPKEDLSGGCGTAKWKNCANHFDEWLVLEQLGIIDTSKYPNTAAGRQQAKAYVRGKLASLLTENSQSTRMLMLFKLEESVDYTSPYTDYLKHINLGLEFREDVDISVTKDVYQIKTTIDGDELVYNYNLNAGINGKTQPGGELANNYIVAKAYSFDIRPSDLAYRVSNYFAKEVQDYLTEFSELNVEVTYRITIDNNAVGDDDNEYVKIKTDEPLEVAINEVMDLYDTNFMQVQFNNDGSMKTGALNGADAAYGAKGYTNSGKYNIVNVKTKNENENDRLVTTEVKVGEAWYFREATDADTGLKYVVADDSFENNDIRDVDGDGDIDKYDAEQAGRKAIYIEVLPKNAVKYDASVNGAKRVQYVKEELVLRGDSYRGSKGRYSNKDNFSTGAGQVETYQTSYGYNVLYITGMDKDHEGKMLTVNEGDSLDIYVKYVLDKSNQDIYLQNEDFEDTVYTTSDHVETSDVINTSDGDILTINLSGSELTTRKETLKRTVKILEKIAGKVEPRGNENIAQVDAYSVWYADGKPASLVDMDSNPGNLGQNGENPDDPQYYEDTVYKTGVDIGCEILADTSLVIPERYEFNLELKPRIITGNVWDDTRSERLGDQNSGGSELSNIQYIGNGLNTIYVDKAKDAIYDLLNGKVDAHINDTVTYKYKTEDVNEEKDIAVRNAKAEFVQIIEVPVDASGNVMTTEGGTVAETHYYEQIMHNVPWEQVQKVRTNEDGKYELKGMIPGNYIIRFTYGDTAGDICPDCAGYGVRGTATCAKCGGKGYTYNADLNTYGEKKWSGSSLNTLKEDMLIFNGQDYKSAQYRTANYEMVTEGYEIRALDDSTPNVIGLFNGDTQISNKLTYDDNLNIIDTAHGNAIVARYVPLDDNETNGDKIVEALESFNLNDARDDEIRRLEANAYSELMNNTKAEILKGIANGDTTIMHNTLGNTGQEKIASGPNNGLELALLTDNTYMEAETVEFTIKTEKLLHDEMPKYITEEGIMYIDLIQMQHPSYTRRNFRLDNVDLGIEYRPENQIHLGKEIKEVKLSSNADSKVLVDLKFETVEEGSTIVHRIIPDESIGNDLTQFISNTYIEYNRSATKKEATQGFVYSQIDQDMLQGTTVEITYEYIADNVGEIDRISKNLNAIRYQGNTLTKQLGDAYGLTEITEDRTREYSSNEFAKLIAYKDLYVKGTNDTTNPDYRLDKKKVTETGDNNYFGKFVGYSYYTGNTGTTVNGAYETLDTVAPLKFKTILDYVDKDLEFTKDSTASNLENRNWNKKNWVDLKDVVEGLNTNRLRSIKDFFITYEQVTTGVGTSVLTNDDTDVRYTTDPDGYFYDTLVTSNDSRVQDMMEENSKVVDNDSLSRFLIPARADEGKYALTNDEVQLIIDNYGANNLIETDTIVSTAGDHDTAISVTKSKEFVDLDTYGDVFTQDVYGYIIKNRQQSSARITLPLSKVISSETEADEMTYENFGEVVEFVTLTGRRTDFETTIGNANVNPVDDYTTSSGSVEYMVASIEPDASATETVRFIPPTGLMLNRQRIVNVVETTNNIVIPVVAAIVAVMVVIGIIYTIITKRRKYIK